MLNNQNDILFLSNLLPDVQEDEKPLAMAFIRRQTELDLYELNDGFQKGTIFRQLYKPFNRGIDD